MVGFDRVMRYEKIFVTGTLSYDFIMDFPGRFADRIMPDKIHKISLSFLVDKLTKQFGGTSGNIAYTLKLLGLNPVIVSVAGRDFTDYRLFLKKAGLNITSIKVRDNAGTSSYFVVTDRDDNQIGSFFVGATKYASALSVKAIVRDADNPFVIVAPTDPKAMVSYVRECRVCRYPYLYDPAFQTSVFTKEELSEGIAGADIVIGNDYEIALMEEKLGISHEELIVMTPILITTLGAGGSVIETRKASIHIRAAKPQSVTDPTGAGDAYRAGFLAGYVRGYDLPTCGRMGSVAAVYTVEKYGTVTHAFTKREFAERYKQNYHETLPL